MRGKNEVVDLQTYRTGDTAPVAEEGPQYLPAGTSLLLGQYTITGYLNCGGFGITYLARDSLGRSVVIKECFPGELCFRSGKSMAARTPRFKQELASIIRHFVHEAHRLANVSHPNIVHVHQIFEENDTAYMAMDYIEGPDLLDAVTEGTRRFTPKEVVELTGKMLQAIKYVHDRGMLHRDISPDNILIDRDGEPVLIDFGAAREHAQKTGRALSKLKFVKDGYSPQEFYISGSEQGTWSDLYSFAASMYHVITGNAPVDGQTRLAALAARKPDPYKPLAGSVAGYPARFLRAVDKALEIMPEKRIQTADEWLGLISTGSTRAKSRPITAAVEQFGAMPVSGSVLRVAAEKRAFAVGVIVAGVSILALAAVPFVWRGAETTPNRQSAPILAAAAPISLNLPDTTETMAAALPSVESTLDRTSVPVAPASSLAALPTETPQPVPASTRIPPQPAPPTAFDAPRPAALTETKTPVVAQSLDGAGALPSLDAPERAGVRVPGLPDIRFETAAFADVTPPKPSAGSGPSDQIAYSRWGITPARGRAAERAKVVSVDANADLAVSGRRIAEGATLFSSNGETLVPETPLSTDVMKALSVDPDGYARAAVSYRDPSTGAIRRGVLVAPVFREIGLSDGTVLKTGVENQLWVTRVDRPAPEIDLRAGDILAGETLTGTMFRGHEDIANALAILALSGAEAATFTVLRDGARQSVTWRLAAD